MDDLPDSPCELCTNDGGEVALRTDLLRIVMVNDPDYPGFCRVILSAHVKEMTDLNPSTLARVMAAVCAVEDALRVVMTPYKVNVASLGNVTPHLHWHVVPRFVDDAHFPQAIWGQRQRETASEVLAARRALLPQLMSEIKGRMPR